MAEYTQTKFDSKSFNPVAFGKYVERIPTTKKTEMVKSRALRGNEQIRQAFSGQTGLVFATIPMTGRIGGTPLNYDGKTNITAQTTDTFERGVVVVGRAQAWTEMDFSTDVTGGVDFMNNVAQQVAEYWDGVDQDTVLSILSGIFAMTGGENAKFVSAHTTDITAVTGADKDGNAKNCIGATTLNSAIQKACGDAKQKFTLAFMHSAVSTNLENLRLLAYLKYTDAQGVTRDLSVATWNGRAVLIDDSMPATEGYFKATSSDEGALKVVATGATGAQVNLADATPYFGEGTLAADDYVVKGTQYITYIMGDGAFDFENVGVKVPYEMDRDPAKNGGLDTLYSRQRKVFAPYGISFTKKTMASNSPTDAELKNGGNWTLVHNGGTTKSYIDHKTIPIARIISRG